MLVWPPIPLQPLEDGPDRKFAHSDRFALAMTIAPAAFICLTMNASDGVEPASAHEPAVVGMPVVFTLSLTITGMPRSGRWSPRRRAASALRASARAVGLTVMTALQLRVELLDPVEVELDELDRRQPVPVHQGLELRDGASHRRRCRPTLVFVGWAASTVGVAGPATPSRSASSVARTRERRTGVRIAGTSTGSGGRARGCRGSWLWDTRVKRHSIGEGFREASGGPWQAWARTPATRMKERSIAAMTPRATAARQGAGRARTRPSARPAPPRRTRPPGDAQRRRPRR